MERAADERPFFFEQIAMAYLDKAAANALLEEVVRQRYTWRRSPVPGSIVKLELLKRATAIGKTFDEKELGFSSFFEFISDCSGVVVQRRQGSDFVVVPPGEATEQAAPEAAAGKERIRRDFWRAFISFPVVGTRRVYDRANDRVGYEEETKPAGPYPIITPFPKEQQLVWRREFATKLGETGQELLTAVNSSNPFREFSIVVRRQPKWAREWNGFLLSKVFPVIQAWASYNNVPNERWLMSETVFRRGPLGRREIYAILDRVPLEELLQLKVPLGWLLRSRMPQQTDEEFDEPQ